MLVERDFSSGKRMTRFHGLDLAEICEHFAVGRQNPSLSLICLSGGFRFPGLCPSINGG